MTAEEIARMESEIHALRVDQEDGATSRYGTIQAGGIAHVLSGWVGLGTECGRTARRYIPARDAERVCRRCSAK